MGREQGVCALLLCAAACASSLTACGSTGTVGPAEFEAAAERLDSLARQDQRLADMAYRLSVANADLCPDRAAVAGWTLHAASQYGAEMRPAAETRFNLDRDLPGVLAVAPGGPAEAAGLQPGDLLLGIDGASMTRGEAARHSYAGLAANIDLLDAALAQGPSTLTYSRGGVSADTILTPVPACAYPFQLDPSAELNSRADGKRVFVTTAMMAFAPRDEDLAVIVAHELAHNLLRHSAATVGPDGRRRGGGPAVLPWRLLEHEREADRVGLYLMARAGYPVDGAGDFMRRFGEANWRIRQPQWGHDSAETRARAMDATAAAIAASRSAGDPLIP